jgi:hypothetical protein
MIDDPVSRNNKEAKSQQLVSSNINAMKALIHSSPYSPPPFPDAAQGSLQATILSAYDLPFREPPSSIQLFLRGKSSQPFLKAGTGPPMQRHKDRNSFKFPSAPLTLRAPLRELYGETAVVEILYDGHKRAPLRATYQLDQLKVGETTWLILQMDNTNSDRTTAHDDDEDDAFSALRLSPTLRLQLTLTGPYRTEIAALVGMAQQWFALMDRLECKCQQLPQINAKLVLIPLVPVVAMAMVAAPVVLGILTIGLPLFLPVLVLALFVAGILVVCAFLAWSSTRHGRSQVGGWLGPLLSTVTATRQGQALLYQTGPRPSPVQLLQPILPKEMWSKLVLSLAIDAIGSASYLIPIAGEFADIGWAPLQTLLLMAMYDKTSPNLKYLSFAEELLPFTDIIPSGTLGWLAEFALPIVMHKETKGSSSEPRVVARSPETSPGC